MGLVASDFRDDYVLDSYNESAHRIAHSTKGLNVHSKILSRAQPTVALKLLLKT
jgi:hypothetical protein